MNCEHCDQLARYVVTGRGKTVRVCDAHLSLAQKTVGVPRETVRIELGLFDGEELR